MQCSSFIPALVRRPIFWSFPSVSWILLGAQRFVPGTAPMMWDTQSMPALEDVDEQSDTTYGDMPELESAEEDFEGDVESVVVD